jgi:hypothetical protein
MGSWCEVDDLAKGEWQRLGAGGGSCVIIGDLPSRVLTLWCWWTKGGAGWGYAGWGYAGCCNGRGGRGGNLGVKVLGLGCPRIRRAGRAGKMVTMGLDGG